MQRTLRAIAAGGLLTALVLSPVTAAAESFDGTYTGPLTRYPEDNLLEVITSEASVTVGGSSISGTERFEALRSGDYGEFVEVVLAVTQWVEFSGTVGPDGSFAVPGLSFSMWELRSCEGSESNCNNVFPPSGTPDGYPIDVIGTIAAGVMTAEVVWPGNPQGTYAFTATNPDYAPPTTTTTTAAVTTTSTTAASMSSSTTATPDASEVGVVERGGVIYITSPADGVLEITREDLPEWARDQLVTVGAQYVRIGAPGVITDGDTRVLLDGLPVARVGDGTDWGGIIVEGSSLIFINGVPAATFGGMVIDPGTSPGVGPGIGGPIVSNTCEPGSRIDYPGGWYCTDRGVGLLKEAVRRGDTRIPWNEDGVYAIGDGVIVGTDEATAESAIVVDKGSLILDRPLRNDHPAGTVVVRIPAEYVAQVIAPTGAVPLRSSGGGISPLVIIGLAAMLGLGAWGVTRWQKGREG